MIALLVLSAGGLIALSRRPKSGYVRIGPDGVEYSDILRTRMVGWSALRTISDKADNRSHKPIVLVDNDNKRIVINSAASYSAGSPAIFWMVRYYWKHPEDRGELTSGRALERLRNAQFPTE